MTVLARYLTHPQVKIDPDVPVPLWGLTAFGRARAETLANTGYFSDTTQISSSGEGKAIETAEIIAGKLNVAVEVREAMRENDRSATGFLPPNEFEIVANQFFAKPPCRYYGMGKSNRCPVAYRPGGRAGLSS